MRRISKKVNSFLLIFGSILFLGACSTINDTSETNQQTETTKPEVYEPKANPEASQISSYDHEPLEKQAEKEKELRAEYEKDSYSLDKPFIKLDPYDAAPLSALIMFETEEPVSIQLSVGSQRDDNVIIKNFEHEKTKHEIPVLGLYPDEENKVTIQTTNSKGITKEATVTIKTNPIPHDFMVTELITAHPKKMQAGLTFIIPASGKPYAVDSNAEVRWYSSIHNRNIFDSVENGHYLQTAYVDEDEANSLLMERDFLGKLYNAYHIDIEGYESTNLLHHDVVEMPSGNLLATTHGQNSKYKEDHMHEIDRETGETTQEIDVRKIMPEKASTEYDGKNADVNDWLHQNAIWPDDNGRSILISGRSQDAILKLSYPKGNIKWILAADEDWPEDYEDKLLKPIGDVDFPAGQHAVKAIDQSKDGSQKEIEDIILFDNNNVITRGDKDKSKQYSQAIRYRINEKEMTVEQVWDYGKERGKEFHSPIVGNVQYLYGQDNILITSGAIKEKKHESKNYGKVVEVDALDDDSTELFELDVYGRGSQASSYVYRSYRYPIYPKNWSYKLSE